MVPPPTTDQASREASWAGEVMLLSVKYCAALVERDELRRLLEAAGDKLLLLGQHLSCLAERRDKRGEP